MTEEERERLGRTTTDVVSDQYRERGRELTQERLDTNATTPGARFFSA